MDGNILYVSHGTLWKTLCFTFLEAVLGGFRSDESGDSNWWKEGGGDLSLHSRRIQPAQVWLDRMSVEEARGYLSEGHFLPGSMGPKIEAALSFLDVHPNGKVVITDPPNIARSLDNQDGNRIEA